MYSKMPSQLATLMVVVAVVLACAIRPTSGAKCSLDTSIEFVTCQDLAADSEDALEQALADAAAVFGTFSLEIDSSDVLRLPVDVLDGYKVMEIRFSDDQLTTIPYLMLSHLDDTLVHLYVWKQEISVINRPQAAMPFKASLVAINLSYNKATSIEQQAFSDFPSLTDLYLYDNSLSSVGVNDLSGLTSLRTLQLERNQISQIATGAFSDLESLVSLNLSFNSLQSLQEGAFNGLPTPFGSIDLSANPFDCECELQWLKTWLNDSNLLESSKATCFYPVSAPFTDVDFCPTVQPAFL